MGEPSAVEIRQRLRDSFALDRLWRETMGLPPGDTKEEPLRRVISVLEASGTPYAVIGGIAVQLHSREPRFVTPWAVIRPPLTEDARGTKMCAFHCHP